MSRILRGSKDPNAPDANSWIYRVETFEPLLENLNHQQRSKDPFVDETNRPIAFVSILLSTIFSIVICILIAIFSDLGAMGILFSFFVVQLICTILLFIVIYALTSLGGREKDV